MLRYVSAAGTDFAAAMVVADHTAIYTDGRNDASPAAQESLRRLDTNGRVCGSPVTARASTPVPDPDPDVDRPRTPRAAPLAPRPRTSAPPPGGGSAYYANCAQARAQGAAPIRAGQPGYRAALDRDGDGTACDT
jgi:micrococcal nuclease